MKNLTIAFRLFFKRGQNSTIKVISLGAGLAIGLVLISKIYFEQSYDNFYPDKERTYKIIGSYTIGENKPNESGTISGGVAPGMRNEIPAVEAATRFTKMGDMTLIAPDKSRYKGNVIFADSCLFDVLPSAIRSGNAEQTLSQPMYAMVSEKIAKIIGKGQDVVGQSLIFEDFPDYPFTIGGVFADIPDNSHLEHNIIISLSSLPMFMGDGRDLWIGNERYEGYIKLTKGATPESIAQSVVELQNKYQNPEEMKKYSMDIKYSFMQLNKIHSDSPENKRINLMLGLLALTLLLTSIMNYVLIVISSLVNRNREVAVYKCYGATSRNITNRMLAETFVSLIFSLAAAIAIIVIFRESIEEILQVSIISLFSYSNIIILFGVCILVFLITGIIPSYIFSRIPISSAFKRHVETRRYWKKVLLFFQFMMVSFLVSLLFTVLKQYNLMINDNPGYSFNKTLYFNISSVSNEQRAQIVDQIKRIEGVTNVATCNTIPIFSRSGNLVSEIDKKETLFKFIDLYDVDADYIPLMEIKVIEGRAFSSQQADSTSVMVSRSFSDKICAQLNWKDGVVGKTLNYTEHGIGTIIGVYDNIKIGSLTQIDNRPTAMFYAKQSAGAILVKTSESGTDKIPKISTILKEIVPEKEIEIIPYKTEVTNLYAESLRFGNSILIGAMVVFIISIIGLIGYTNGEIVRRSKEISIRKINGSTALSIISMLSKSTYYMAIPAIIIGTIGSYIAGEAWLKQFSDKISIETTITICICSMLLILSIIIICVVLRTWHVANENPINQLKKE